MRRGLLAVGLVIAVLASLASISVFLGPALGHSVTGSGSPAASPSAPPASPSPSSSLEPFSFQSTDGYGMTLPGGWMSASMEPLQEQLLLSVLHSSNPDVANLVDDVLTATGADISMVGGDVRGLSSNGVPPNISVLTESANGESLGALTQRISGVLGAMDGVTRPVHHTETTLAGVSAGRLDWSMQPATAATQSAAYEVTLQTYLAVHANRLVIVTVAGEASDRASNQPLFDGIVSTFRFSEAPVRD